MTTASTALTSDATYNSTVPPSNGTMWFAYEPPPKPPSKPIHCQVIPGYFILRCYRREILFTWIPPKQPIRKAMIKFKEHRSAKYNTMSDYGWGHSEVQVHNRTLTNLRPNTVYEFGLNLIYENDTFARFPLPNLADMCACKTYPDIPSMPLNLQYHYLRENHYSLEWTPGVDNGEPILTYELRRTPLKERSDNEKISWDKVMFHNLTNDRMNFTLDSQEHTVLQLRAVNKVGAGHPAFLTIRPPLAKVASHKTNSSFVFGSLNHVASVVTYSLLTTGFSLLLLLLLIIFAYRKRRTNNKGSKHPFLIRFNSAKRMTSGSGIDSFGLGGASDLTTSGVPLDLSTLEPLWNQEVNSLYGMGKSDLVSFEHVTQISAANIRFQRYIGCGAFGKVWEGWLHVNDIDGDRFEKVALKVRNSKSLTEAEFRREALLMHRYQHANIVRFFGVSFDSPGQQCLVLEMMDQGNLRDYLHRARPRIAPGAASNMFVAAAAAMCAMDTRAAQCSEGSSMNTSLTSTAAVGGPCGPNNTSNVITLTAQLDLPAVMSIMRDIVNGCRYLEEQHFVHRDIAARNCLVSHNHPSGRIVKLCDFGLARDIYKNDCYRKRNEPKLPVRWMSPEAIRDGLFTTKSDVWAFAVTCWEVMTLGADPFYGRANLDVMNLVIGGHVLGKPENCPEELYNQMLQCWSRFPEMRPSFADLAKKMNEFVKLSQESGSPFSGPFIVTLPLPKSLPDSSGQPMFNCLPNERHFGRELIDPMHNPMHRKCQRQASFNDYGASERMHQARIRQQVSLDENRPSRALNSPDLSACQEQNNSRGCLVSPATRGVHMRPVRAYRNTTTCDLRRAIRFHPASHLTGYEGALSGLSSEQNNFIGGASVATTTAGSTEVTHNGYATHLTNAEKPHSPNWNSNGMAFKMTALSGDGATARPLSLLENSAKSSLKEPTWEMQPMFYRTFNRPIHSAKPSSLDSAMRPHMNLTMPIRNPTTINNNEVPCWLTETGGGVDSLGYERPSWTSQMVTMRNPAMHWSQTQQFSQALAHSINCSAVAAAGNFSG